MSIRKRLRPYLPNRSDRLGLVSLQDAKPFRAYWPLILTQIVGGKTWSISFIRHTTREPIPTLALILSRHEEAAKTTPLTVDPRTTARDETRTP